MITTLRTTALLLLMAGAAALAQTPKWQFITPPGMGGEDAVYGIDFPTATHGFVGIWRFTTPSSSFHITTDGGAHWTSRAMTGTRIVDFRFFDETTGVMAAIQEDNTLGTILATGDGGETWTRATTLPDKPNAFDFVDGQTGYLVGRNGLVMKTVNGGTQWTQLGIPGTSTYSLTDVDFPSANVGYVVASAPGSWPTKIYKTTDGGAGWVQLQDFGGGEGNGKVISRLYFLNEQVGFASGRAGTMAIFRTTDGGASWSTAYQASGSAGVLSVDEIDFADGNVGYAATNDGTVLRTTNAGISWQVEGAAQGTAMSSIDVVDQSTVIAGGLYGAVVKRSVDGPKPGALISAQSLSFGRVQMGGNKELSFTVSAENNAGLRIDRIYVDEALGTASSFTVISPSTEVPIDLEPGSPLTVTVRFTPQPESDSIVIGSLVVATNSPSTPNAYVSLRGRVEKSAEPQPTAVVSGSSIDFGTIETSGTKELSVTVSAGTAAPLGITGLTIDGTPDAFTIVAPAGTSPVTVQPGSPLEIRVRFAPKSAGNASSDLVIGTNDPANASIRVHLLGAAATSISAVAGTATEGSGTALALLPNPVSTEGALSLSLPARSNASVTLLNLHGDRMATLFEGSLEAGTYRIPIDVRLLPNGTYYCQVRTGAALMVRPLIVLH